MLHGGMSCCARLDTSDRVRQRFQLWHSLVTPVTAPPASKHENQNVPRFDPVTIPERLNSPNLAVESRLGDAPSAQNPKEGVMTFRKIPQQSDAPTRNKTCLSPSRDPENSMASFVRRLWGEEVGQDIAEYAVMLAVILVLVVGTVRLIGSNANNAFSSVASSLQ